MPATSSPRKIEGGDVDDGDGREDEGVLGETLAAFLGSAGEGGEDGQEHDASR
jgi:hypothetical protein